MARFFLNSFTCFLDYYQIVINISLLLVWFCNVTFGEGVVDFLFSVNTANSACICSLGDKVNERRVVPVHKDWLGHTLQSLCENLILMSILPAS